MKILKYIIFLSVLCGIFFIIYQQFDKKGFRRWRTSFKRAVFFAAITAGLIPVNPEAIESPGNNNQIYQERLLSDQEFNSFEDNDQKVILVKAGDSPGPPSVPTQPGRGQPSQFPTPPSGGRPSWPSTGVTPSSTYRPMPKVVDQGLGAAANPAGAGGGGGSGDGGGAAEFDDQCPAPKKQQQSQKPAKKEIQPDIYHSKKKKKSDDQCSSDENTPKEINEKFDSKAVEKLVNTALKDQRVRQEYEGIKRRLSEGINPVDIGKKSTNLPGNKVLIKGANGRYVVEVAGDQVNVLGIGARGNEKNMKTFEKLMNKMYDLNLQY